MFFTDCCIFGPVRRSFELSGDSVCVLRIVWATPPDGVIAAPHAVAARINIMLPRAIIVLDDVEAGAFLGFHAFVTVGG